MLTSGQRCQAGWDDIEENERHQFPALLIKEHLAFLHTHEGELEIGAISLTFEANYFETLSGFTSVICRLHTRDTEEVFRDIETLTFLEFARKYIFLHCNLNRRSSSV